MAPTITAASVLTLRAFFKSKLLNKLSKLTVSGIESSTPKSVITRSGNTVKKKTRK